MSKNEKGFGVVEVLLIIVVIGLLAVMGWQFFSRQKDNTTTDSNTTNTQDSVEQKPNTVDTDTYQPVIPESWVQQTDSITGVKYAIPKEFTIKDPNNISGATVEVQNKNVHIQTSNGDTIFNDGIFSNNPQQWVLNDGKATLNSDVEQSDIEIQDKYTTWYTHFGEGIGGGLYYTFSLYTFANDKLYTINFKASACDPSIKFDGESCTKEPYQLTSVTFDDIRNQFIKTVVIPDIN